MTGRVTPRAEPHAESTLRRRSPLVWWIAVISVVSLLIGTIGGSLALVLL